MPIIYGDGIRLRAIERSDISYFVKWFNDPEVTSGLLMVLPMSEAMEEKWFEDLLKRPQESHPLTIEILVEDKLSVVLCWFINVSQLIA